MIDYTLVLIYIITTNYNDEITQPNKISQPGHRGQT